MATTKKKSTKKAVSKTPAKKKAVKKTEVKKKTARTRTLKSHPLEKKSVLKKVEKVMKAMHAEKNAPLKVGAKIKMSFHGAGVTSLEDKVISNFTDSFIWIDCENSKGDFFKFDRKTGKCLNDETFGGFSRTIDPR